MTHVKVYAVKQSGVACITYQYDRNITQHISTIMVLFPKRIITVSFTLLGNNPLRKHFQNELRNYSHNS